MRECQQFNSRRYYEWCDALGILSSWWYEAPGVNNSKNYFRVSLNYNWITLNYRCVPLHSRVLLWHIVAFLWITFELLRSIIGISLWLMSLLGMQTISLHTAFELTRSRVRSNAFAVSGALLSQMHCILCRCILLFIHHQSAFDFDWIWLTFCLAISFNPSIYLFGLEIESRFYTLASETYETNLYYFWLLCITVNTHASWIIINYLWIICASKVINRIASNLFSPWWSILFVDLPEFMSMWAAECVWLQHDVDNYAKSLQRERHSYCSDIA